MSNTYFQFKQFVIHQDLCAMKVSTDSCLFGAWLSKVIIPSLPGICDVLDIGVGTGLLMLMQAQDHPLSIDGIEIDELACHQALLNIESSKWKDRLKLYQGDVRAFVFDKQYDLIISNPPFYENDLRPSVASRATAMHDASLSFDELLTAVSINLNPDGYFALLIPFHRFDYLNRLAFTMGFNLHKVVHVQHRMDHSFIRSMVLLSRKPAKNFFESMAIREINNSYSTAFVNLLKCYYLDMRI